MALLQNSNLLNYLEISDDIKFIIDDNKLKQNHYIPGTKIKIVSKDKINNKIEYLIVFAWNYFDEIKKSKLCKKSNIYQKIFCRNIKQYFFKTK